MERLKKCWATWNLHHTHDRTAFDGPKEQWKYKFSGASMQYINMQTPSVPLSCFWKKFNLSFGFFCLPKCCLKDGVTQEPGQEDLQPLTAQSGSYLMLNFITMTKFAKWHYFPHCDNFMVLLFFDSHNYKFVFTNNSGERSSLLFRESEYDGAQIFIVFSFQWTWQRE